MPKSSAEPITTGSEAKNTGSTRLVAPQIAPVMSSARTPQRSAAAMTGMENSTSATCMPPVMMPTSSEPAPSSSASSV